MTITYYTATFTDAAGQKIAGSVLWDKRQPSALSAQLARLLAPSMQDYAHWKSRTATTGRAGLDRLKSRLKQAAKRAGLTLTEERETRFAPVEVSALAVKFHLLLRETIGAANLAQVAQLNATESNPAICHSHDFCDANEVMAAAWLAVVGRPIDLQSDSDSADWAHAWQYFKAYLRA